LAQSRLLSDTSMEREVQRPRLHPTQRLVKSEAARFNVLCAGRRWGKNILLRDVLVEPALAGFPVAWMAPTYKMLSEDWRGIRSMLASVTKEKHEDEHRLELITGGVVDMWSLDQPDAARGRKYKRVGINEAAQIAGLQDAWEQVVRPTLTDYIGDAWFTSTPRGQNFFWRLWQRGQDRLGFPEWKSWVYPTSTNPYISPDEIEAARNELPARVFEQEYLADFIDRAGAVFRNLDAVCIVSKQDVPSAHKGHSIFAGVDWGKANDFTVITVGCRDCHKAVAWDRMNVVDYALQRGRIKALTDKWHPVRILAESNSIGEPNLEMLQREGMRVEGFATTASSKPPLIEGLVLALERAELLLPEEYRGELQSYELKVNPSTQRPTYNAPSGMNDDRVISAALLWRAMTSGGVVAIENTLFD
jgi:hypothetical protein